MIKLTWVDVGKATEPGRYDSRYGLIEVTSDDLWIWQKYPNAAFVVMQPSPYSDETVCRLGTFELREDWNVPGYEKGVEPALAEASDDELDDLKHQPTNTVTPPKSDPSDLGVRLDRYDPVTAPPAAEAAEETQIGPLDSVEPPDELQRRIDALIKGL
jgi:hypothetical protein